MNQPDQPTPRTDEADYIIPPDALILSLERELAAERERVRLLREHGIEALMVARSWQMVWGDKLSPDSVAIFTKHEQAFLAGLAATEAKT
jgi:hypothetical protein